MVGSVYQFGFGVLHASPVIFAAGQQFGPVSAGWAIEGDSEPEP
ncbi:MAG: hypothetical protein EDM05_000500 [Leptolyngbya sp. IPPAS B-1204]